MNNRQLEHILAERKSLRSSVSEDEWAARVELAACYRLIAHFRMTDWIYNHISLRVPGSHEHYLINPFGLLYEEITASSLVKVDVAGRSVDDSPFGVNPAAFVIHGAIHSARHDVACVLHTHTSAGVGVAAQAHGLLPISQHALKFYGRVAYHEYEGIALDNDEQQRLVASLGDKSALILRNHGLLTTGSDVAEAFGSMFYLERACQIQIAALAGGSEIRRPPAAVCERTAQQFATGGDDVGQGRDWQAMLRLLDRLDPGYAE